MYIGIDVGGTNLKAGLVDESGHLVAVERTPLDFQSPEQFAAATGASGGGGGPQGAPLARREIACVGMGAPRSSFP